VEKDRFLSLLKNFTSLSEADAAELNTLQKHYPYSQVVHTLATRAARDNRMQSYTQLLNLTAVYSTDRSVLKLIMTQPQGMRKDGIVHKIAIDQIAEQQQHDHLSGEELLHEIETDLAKLKESKHSFEVSWDEYERLAHAHEVEAASQKPLKTKVKVPVSKDDGLIEEIKITKKEVDLDGEKQKAQSQIIDRFIKTAPSIQKGKPGSVTVTATDLSENSSDFSDNIISETLVDILIKQGKRDKAIDMLRKLIWKFPQKKAIFAARIEELKK
jgi:predicted SnoaL-like aldol condensation-catalyzing enzyme